MINVGIVGVSGYSGLKALQLLLKHPQVRVNYISANNTTGPLSEIWPQIHQKTKLVCERFDLKNAVESCEIIFLAVPHKISMAITPGLLKAGLKVIDLSGDYRLHSSALYKKWYGTKHTDSRNLKKAVYGLPELYRADIQNAQLVANPGCYPTAALLALAPLVSIHGQHIDSITIDAKSGVSGAGRKALVALSAAEVNENFRAYKMLDHQHAPEINQFLSQMSEEDMDVDFVPHLLPIKCGIFETIYVRLGDQHNVQHIQRLYERFYKTEPFVRVLKKDQLPEIQNVVGSNYCDIALRMHPTKNLLVITSVIDNLIKGAAGQAVQNMNIMKGYDESLGL